MNEYKNVPIMAAHLPACQAVARLRPRHQVKVTVMALLLIDEPQTVKIGTLQRKRDPIRAQILKMSLLRVETLYRRSALFFSGL